MKPNSIVQFERLYLASILVWIVSSALSFGESMTLLKARAPDADFGMGTLIAVQLMICAIAAGVWYLIVKRRSAVGKWLLSTWFLINTCIIALGLFLGGLTLSLVMVLSWLAYALGTWGLSYLFKADAEAWFAKAPSA